MKLLIVASYYPMHDRASGEFRFYQLLHMLADRYDVFFCSIAEKTQIDRIGRVETQGYRLALEKLDITVLPNGVGRALRENRYAAVLFEFWNAARPHIDAVRVCQPEARIIVDSVDVTFHRLFSKARLTGVKEDQIAARRRKIEELSVYSKADITVTVTDEDACILHQENPKLKTVTIPNIHPMYEPVAPNPEDRSHLVFVGNFKHEPNRDAMLFFCREVLPLITEAAPRSKVRIIGNAPPTNITSLASPTVEVLGYVADTRPYLETSGISIAPLRFGGGMKGKIGEAMSHALPVVTTSVGIEGFGLQPGLNVLVGDTAEEFAGAVLSLLQDEQLYERVRMAGYHFIRDRFSEPAVRDRVYAFFEDLDSYPVKRIPVSRKVANKAKALIGRYVAWRIR